MSNDNFLRIVLSYIFQVRINTFFSEVSDRQSLPEITSMERTGH